MLFDAHITTIDDCVRLIQHTPMLDTSLDKSLADQVLRLTPLGPYYLLSQLFIAKYSMLDMGRVAHAVAATVREITDEYLVITTQLENQFRSTKTFNINKFYYYLAPTIATLHGISSIIIDLTRNDARGGKILNILSEKMIREGG